MRSCYNQWKRCGLVCAPPLLPAMSGCRGGLYPGLTARRNLPHLNQGMHLRCPVRPTCKADKMSGATSIPVWLGSSSGGWACVLLGSRQAVLKGGSCCGSCCGGVLASTQVGRDEGSSDRGLGNTWGCWLCKHWCSLDGLGPSTSLRHRQLVEFII